jgi:hypothetical protein
VPALAPAFNLYGLIRALARQISPELSQTFSRMLAPSGARHVVAGVDRKVAAVGALATQIILEELNARAAVCALCVKYILRFPVPQVLARAMPVSHYLPPATLLHSHYSALARVAATMKLLYR